MAAAASRARLERHALRHRVHRDDEVGLVVLDALPKAFVARDALPEVRDGEERRRRREVEERLPRPRPPRHHLVARHRLIDRPAAVVGQQVDDLDLVAPVPPQRRLDRLRRRAVAAARVRDEHEDFARRRPLGRQLAVPAAVADARPVRLAVHAEAARRVARRKRRRLAEHLHDARARLLHDAPPAARAARHRRRRRRARYGSQRRPREALRRPAREREERERGRRQGFGGVEDGHFPDARRPAASSRVQGRKFALTT